MKHVHMSWGVVVLAALWGSALDAQTHSRRSLILHADAPDAMEAGSTRFEAAVRLADQSVVERGHPGQNTEYDPGTHVTRGSDGKTATTRALLFPGGGHFYSGETARGAALLGAAVGAIALGAVLSSGEEKYNVESHQYEKPSRLPLVAGVAGAAVLWGYGVMDASRSVERMSRRSSLAVGSARIRPQPVLALGIDGPAQAGAHLRIEW